MPSNPASVNEIPEDVVLSCYEQIADASGQMLNAARSADWDGLVEAEMNCANLICKVGMLSKRAAISPNGNVRRMKIIRRVLADDAEIRVLVEPRLATLEGFLHGRGNGRRVQNAYAQ